MNWKVIAFAALGLAFSFHSQANDKTLQGTFSAVSA